MAEKMVDRVTRIMQHPTEIRNIAICAHIDHGKTTLSDNLLSGAGMLSEALAGKACVLDFHEDEQTRGITIDSASVSMVHKFDDKEYLINLIDTPGHVDFGGDVTRAMRAVDGAVVLCCAVEGIMPQTETVLRQALKERVKPILFINKTDRLMKELQLTPEMMQERFVKTIDEVNKLIVSIAEEGYGSKWQVSVNDGSVVFGSAFHNWAMSVPYMQKKGLSFKDIIDAYQSGNDDDWKALGKRAPLYEVLLNSVIEHLPDPVVSSDYRIPKLWKGDVETEDGKSLKACNPKGPLYFCIVKVVVDPQAGEISSGRLFSGTMKRGTEVYLNTAKHNGRVQQVFIYNGSKREIVDNVPAGNIIGISGVKGYPGETITVGEAEPFEELSHIFDPVITKSIEAKKASDLTKLLDVLRMVAKEDPTIKININEETGEHLMSGMGELHLEIIENRIKSEKGVEVITGSPIVVYREAVYAKNPQAAEGKSPNKHNRLYFTVEPMPEELKEGIKSGLIPNGRVKKKDNKLWEALSECGLDSKATRKVRDVFNGNMFIDDTRGEVHIGEIMELVLDMFEDVMNNGGLAREPCVNMLVRLTDTKLHEDAIHRGPAQMYPAVREGIREAIRNAKPVLYEPIQTMVFESPAEFMGEISKLISNKRGQLLDMQQDGDEVTVKGKLPVAEMFGMSGDLRSATGGRGNSFVQDQVFEKLPDELQKKIIGQIRSRKGLSENQ
ncbi:elongation factor EF-2 [Candidatus Woesearchaeota archaeon]|jgi:elongation factor 2|nr:elongation factor EF-2 [Candidatus Woesearchaeota archaeon]MBT3537819.1 elongation factor EF-2 [Candidatus Woesearchaeota archaeon]MBT4697950.1 elongation factor EF-2 [Candidatus Woesearchaeota archaeon]MBT7105488.1 elongation factor EF-2 [Candidatus Woesearchaeota archaeon]MBT7931678.1 elongation factor EF-2 [Candidatus Woesearchaeota archaeon]